MNTVLNVTAAIYDAWDEILSSGHERAAPRSNNPNVTQSIDVSPYAVRIAQPRAYVPLLPGRGWSPAYAVGELCWYLSGSNQLDFIRAYAPKYHEYSDDGKTAKGAYGPMLTRGLFNVIELLEQQPDTRRATIVIGHTGGLFENDCLDVPCTMCLQFIRSVRLDGIPALNLLVTARSTDCWIGLTYDLFTWCFLLCQVADTLNWPVGTLTFITGSAHVYAKNINSVKRCRAYRHDSAGSAKACEQIEHRTLQLEHDLRTGKYAGTLPGTVPYETDVERILTLRWLPNGKEIRAGLQPCWQQALQLQEEAKCDPRSK